MSRIPLAKYEDVHILGQQSTVPPGWGRLFSCDIEASTEMLGGIERNRYKPLGTQPPINGEVWTCRTNDSTTPFQVIAGHLQLFVLSGSLSVTKNGATFLVKTGEKVNFQPRDVFTLQGNPEASMVVRNERAEFAPGNHPQTKTPSLVMSQQVVNTVRAQLGLTSEAPLHRTLRYEGPRSSADYRGRPKY